MLLQRLCFDLQGRAFCPKIFLAAKIFFLGPETNFFGPGKKDCLGRQFFLGRKQKKIGPEIIFWPGKLFFGPENISLGPEKQNPGRTKITGPEIIFFGPGDYFLGRTIFFFGRPRKYWFESVLCKCSYLCWNFP